MVAEVWDINAVAKQWPAMWNVTQHRFEEVLIKKWQHMSVKTPRRIFNKTFQEELKLFLEAESFDEAVKAEEENTTIPVAVLSRLLRQQVGQQLFQAEAQNAKWLGFLDSTNKRLQDLMHLDWAASDRENFFAVSKTSVKDLLQLGFQVYGKYEVTCTYFGHTYKVQVSTLHEVAPVMYQLLLRQIVVNTGQIPAMPWQEHLKSSFGGSIPGIPEVTVVDKAILGSISGAREILVSALKDCTTYDAMARELRLARDSVRAIDPYFYLEEDFFVQQVPGLVERIIYDKVLAVLPVEHLNPHDANKVFGKGEAAHKDIAILQACAMVRHCLPAVGKAVNGAMMIVRAMLDGESLSVKTLRSSSEFHRKIYQRCSNFLIFEHDNTMAGATHPALCGAPAMSAHIKHLDLQVLGPKPIDLGSLEIFRQFRWLLSSEDDARIQKLIVDERRKRQNFLENRMIKDGIVLEEGIPDEDVAQKSSLVQALALGPLAGSTSWPSSSSKDPGPIQSEQPPAKKAKAASSKEMDARMALFLPKWMADKAPVG
jgi:hypothetical protein